MLISLHTWNKIEITHKLFQICITLCWLWGLLFLSFYLSPWVGLAYFPDEYTWGYDDSEMSEAAETVELYATVSQLTLCGIMYGLIAIKLIAEVCIKCSYVFSKIVNET